ncbi:DUF1493 family protein [Desertivirga arenae]|uniref:DUF1493 family protein n=1 Tax=Desertivirga arenae TaxID=2810309 RepID=UPI001A96011C|nr:DUF1493 family protein [Pedobacter sp. SYSU D00823]
MKTIKCPEFSSLRKAYIEVKTFIEAKVGADVESINTRNEEDLGWTGDDSYELIADFVAKYHLDVSGFDFSKHFLNEGELFQPLESLVLLFFAPIHLIVWLISFGQYRPQIPHSDFLAARKTEDLTFGDMLAWYVKGGSFSTRDQVYVQLKKN